MTLSLDLPAMTNLEILKDACRSVLASSSYDEALLHLQAASLLVDEDMADAPAEDHDDKSGGVKSLAVHTAKPRQAHPLAGQVGGYPMTEEGKYGARANATGFDQRMADRQRSYVERLGVRVPRA